MDRLIDLRKIEAWLDAAQAWLMADVLSYATLAQAVAIAVAFLAALLVHRPAHRFLFAQTAAEDGSVLTRLVYRLLAALTLPIAWVLLLVLATLAAHAVGLSDRLIDIAISLLLAWIVIRLAGNLIRSRPVRRIVVVVAWTIAALNIVGLLERAIAALDSVAFKLGQVQISLLTVVNSVILLFLLLWFAGLLSTAIAHRVRSSKDLTPSVQVLVTQLLRILLVVVAILVAVETVGLDLSALAVFGGALGVGIGFGLQKIVSNFISGIILLLDKSIKPGDVIAVEGDTYGWIKGLHARYVSVLTRDGSEVLIPNETLITERVENWSYSDRNVRFKIPIGVSYHSDVELALKLCMEAAGETPRVHDEPKPNCLIRGFGDSSVDLELRIWVDDPEAGRGNVQSEVLLRVWKKFHQHGIQIPFPQRDLHIRSSDAEIRVRQATAKEGGEA